MSIRWWINWHRARKITFSRRGHEGAILYRLHGFTERRAQVMHDMIAELTQRVMEPYGTLSRLRIKTEGCRARKGYETERGLADDVYSLLKAYRAEPVWRDEHSVALWSDGCHRKLIQYLMDHCWTGRCDPNPYWAGDFWMYGYRKPPEGLTDDALWAWINSGNTYADLIVSYWEGAAVWMEIKLRCADPEEERRICRLVKQVSEKYRAKVDWEHVDVTILEE